MNTKSIESITGIPIQKRELYEEAFTHKSYTNEHSKYAHNERLEFLGDAVLELIITEYLFETFPHEPEGKMTKLRSALVSGISLSEVSKKLNLGEHIRLSQGEEKSGGKTKDPLLADLFEALVGALFIDAGYQKAEEFVHKHLLSRLPEVLKKNLYVDPKSDFQERAQEKWEITPLYKVIDESGPDHKKIFTVEVLVGSQVFGAGKGSSKQKAEISAAENALKKIKE